MKKEIYDILYKNDKLVVNRISEKYFKKHHNDILIKINNKVTSDCNFNIKLYLYSYDIKDIPTCRNCGNKLSNVNKFSFTNGFPDFCSKKCMYSSKEVIDKRKNTLLKKYGVEHAIQSEKIKSKRKETNLKKYGVEHVTQLETVKNKIKNTLVDKYGVEHVSKIHGVREKIEETNLKKYGHISSFSNKIIQNKYKNNLLDKYGVEHVSKIYGVREKIEETNLKKYGYKVSSKNDTVKEKLKKTIKNKIESKYNIKFIDEKNIEVINDCKIHKSYVIDFKNFYQRKFKYKIDNLCTKCNPIGNVFRSGYENKIENDIIKNYSIDYELNNKKIISNEIDFYFPNHKIGIEINGIYWHSDIFKDKLYHYNKTKECKEKGIQLLHIWEFDLINKKDIIYSIIKNKLNLTKDKIYARKCIIKEVSSNECKDFLNENHLQGFVVSKYRYGLYYDDKLVSLMTFGKLRKNLNQINKKDSYELLRFCNKLNTNVIGGASKLLKYFEKNIKPKLLISYANQDISNGSLYYKLGFNFESYTTPTYWWIDKNGINHNRFKFRKDVLVRKGFDKNKTEDEIMKELKYYKIYNSGNIKFKKDYNYVTK
ncbi:MAG: DUF7487 domain-containing protein [bacterium]